MNALQKRNRVIEVLIVIFLIMTSGYMGIGSVTSITIPMFCISFVLFFIHKERITISMVLLLTVFFILLCFQRKVWGGSMGNILAVEIQLVSFSLLASCVYKSFHKLFPQVIIVVSAISLFFWIFDRMGAHDVLLNLGRNFPIDLENQNDTMDGYSFLLYAVNDSDYRNPGPFFEPGRFIVSLVPALAMNLSNEKSLFKKGNIILLLSILSTFSTTGYSITMIIIALFLLYNKKNKKYSFILLVLAGIIFLPSILRLDFMAEKVMDQVQDIDNSNSRFGALVYLWLQVLESPWFGYGPAIQQIWHMSSEVHISSPNGWGELMRYWGIPFSFVFCVLLFLFSRSSAENGNKFFAWSIFLAILLVAFPQSVMQTPLYYVFAFSGFLSFSNNKL